MAKRTSKKLSKKSTSAKAAQSTKANRLDLRSIVSEKSPKRGEKAGELSARLYFSTDKSGLIRDKQALKALPEWQKEMILNSPNKLFKVTGDFGVNFYFWIDRETKNIPNEKSLEAVDSTRIRDLCGPLTAELEHLGVTHLTIEILKAASGAERAFALGLELASYRYLKSGHDGRPFSYDFGAKANKTLSADVEDGRTLGAATNLARHLVNLPPNLLNPKSYSEAIKNLFANTKNTRLEIWDEKRLEQENMGLLLGVGKGAEHPPRLVHLRYRPKRSREKQPWAIVGKGITFDSGGLDIKPSSAMRWMKKDMGGSAAAVAFAWWCVQTEFPQAMDFYFSLAENAVGSRSFRPGDVLKSRAGYEIEISNTDAEGRLVLADALDVAVTQDEKNQPSLVINLATLTGAIKVALGSQLAGLFSNDLKLRDQLFKASQAAGDLSWPMPLFQDYRPSMGSPFATMTNSVEGFGGAITAALFLESFVRKVPWAHLDIYAWKDSASGAYLESGGNGQGVQLLAHWAQSRVK